MISIVIAIAVERLAKVSKQKAVRVANIYCQFIAFRWRDKRNGGNKTDKKKKLLLEENNVSTKKSQNAKQNAC